jgi:hypothetical protein
MRMNDTMTSNRNNNNIRKARAWHIIIYSSAHEAPSLSLGRRRRGGGRGGGEVEVEEEEQTRPILLISFNIIIIGIYNLRVFVFLL